MKPRRTQYWTQWFPLVWLVFLFFPLVALIARPRPWFEYVYGLVILTVFVAVFVWAYWFVPWVETFESRPLRPASMISALVCYATMLLLYPLIGAYGIGMLIYAGSFAGTQRSSWPAMTTIVISLAVSVIFHFTDGVPWIMVGMMVFFTVVATIGNQIGYREALSTRALERSQQEVARIAKVAERERIARDLHDLLGHTLSVIVLKSELASRLAEKNPARAAKEIREVERIARESLQEVRSAVRGYRSAGLEAEFANVSLALEAAQVKLEQFIQPVELEWAHEQALAFCLRESVTNVIRHARAKRCWINLEQRSDSVLLEIWDDGGGKIKFGNGVRGMRERVETLGGTLETTTSAGYAGISLKIPLSSLEVKAVAAGLGLEGT